MSVRLALRNPFTGKRLSITRPTKETAEEVRAKVFRVFADMRDGHLGVAEGHDRVEQIVSGRVRPMVVDGLFEDYLATLGTRERKRLGAHWGLHFEPSFGGKHPLQLNETIMAGWYRTIIDGGYQPSYAQKLYEELQAAINLAIRVGKIALLPWHGWRPRKVARNERGAAASVDEVVRVLRVAQDIDAAAWRTGGYSDLAARLEVLFTSGIRQAEAAALGWDHVVTGGEFPQLFVEFQTLDGWTTEHPEWNRPQYPPKGRQTRRVRLGEATLHTLAAHRAQLERFGGFDPHGPVFPSVPNRAEFRKLPRVVTSDVMRKCVEAAGIPNAERWVTHSARHSFVSVLGRQLAKEGRNVKEIMNAVGHKNLRQLADYTHAAEGPPAAMAMPTRAEAADGGDNVIAPDFGHVRESTREDGAPDTPPSAVDAAASTRVYHRAYSKVLRATGDTAQARLAGKRAQRGFEGAAALRMARGGRPR